MSTDANRKDLVTPTLAINEQDSGGIPESHQVVNSIFDSTTRDNFNTARAYGMDDTNSLPDKRLLSSINTNVNATC